MEQYHITGMSCAACSARVEKAVSRVLGVESCAVSLLTNSMGVEGKASSADIIKAVKDAGYGASLKEKGKLQTEKKTKGSEDEAVFADQETPVLKKRLLTSLIFLLILMYFSMGHMMWGWPLPSFFDGNHVAMGLVQLLLAAVIMVINQKFFISGFKSLLHGAPNMDTLVALGSGVSFLYSTYALFAMTDAQVKGDSELVMSYMHEFYFESAAMILTLITVGKMLEARSKGKTTDALKSLIKLSPKTAVIIEEGQERSVPVEQVQKGNLFVVRPGESIPVDGIVLEGSSAVNEAALTGESIPVDKQKGSSVSAATLNQSGFLKCEAKKVGEDTTLSQIIKMVSDAAATKAPIAKIADRVSGVFVPVVISIALLTVIVWLLLGESAGFALARGISVLVISCPCALGLATPVAIMVGNGVGAKNGILFKTAVSLEEAGKVKIIALDKTGTITSGEPEVTDVLPAEGFTKKELIDYAALLEEKSEHPLAKAVLKYVKTLDSERQRDSYSLKEKNNRGEGARMEESAELTDFVILPGNGLKGSFCGETLTGGNYELIYGQAPVPDNMKEAARKLSEEGKTPLYFAKGNRFLGIVAVADVIKKDSPEAIRELKNMGIRVVMLTGDNGRTAKAIGDQAGVDEVIAGVLPDGKEAVIRKLKEQGKTAMVGDGINDAPALTRADIGIAIGAGTDIAIDAANIVLMKSSLKDVAASVRLSRATLTNIHENLFWAFFYNCIGIPLAAGVFISAFGWKLNPMFGAAAMSLSSFCVVTNALRLNLVKIYDASKDKARKHKERKDKADKKSFVTIDGDREEKRTQEEGKQVKAAGIDIPADHDRNSVNSVQKEDLGMTKTMKIEGMMCGHCEATVKKALESLDGVAEAVVSHEKGNAVVTLNGDVADDVLRKAVEDKDYKVLEVQ